LRLNKKGNKNGDLILVEIIFIAKKSLKWRITILFFISFDFKCTTKQNLFTSYVFYYEIG